MSPLISISPRPHHPPLAPEDLGLTCTLLALPRGVRDVAQRPKAWFLGFIYLQLCGAYDEIAAGLGLCMRQIRVSV